MNNYVENLQEFNQIEISYIKLYKVETRVYNCA